MANAIHRTIKNVHQHRPLQSGRALSSVNSNARRLGTGNNNNNNNNNSSFAATSTSAMAPPAYAGIIHLQDGSQQQQQQSLVQNSSSLEATSHANPNDVVGISRLGAASQPPPFAASAAPNSSSHHKDGRASSSPLRGLASSVPSSSSSSPSSSSQVLSASMSTQSLHLPNGLRTLPPGHPARAALTGSDNRTRTSVTVGVTTAGVHLGLTGPAAKGQETVTAATHLLASSGSHAASKLHSSSS